MSSSSDLSERLRKIAGDLEAALGEHAEQAGSDPRRQAAERLAARLKRIAGTAPEPPTDEGSLQAIDQAMKMIRAVFPSWSPRVKEEPGGDA